MYSLFSGRNVTIAALVAAVVFGLVTGQWLIGLLGAVVLVGLHLGATLLVFKLTDK